MELSDDEYGVLRTLFESTAPHETLSLGRLSALTYDLLPDHENPALVVGSIEALREQGLVSGSGEVGATGRAHSVLIGEAQKRGDSRPQSRLQP